jgi:DNA-directed RNA polymerase I subunit RPA1
VSGTVDKAAFGKFGLVHAVQELYGNTAAGRLLSAFSRLFTAYVQWHGFTCGFDDLLLVARAEAKRTVGARGCEAAQGWGMSCDQLGYAQVDMNIRAGS